MRFAHILLVAFALMGKAEADHTGEAENEGYGVTAGANAWDQRGADNNGCTVDGVDGCRPELTRDFELNFDPNSRWSCSESLGVDTCQLYFDFGSPVELINVRIGFHKGDQRKRTIKFWNGDVGDESLGTYTSSGSTLGYDVFPVTTDSKNVHRLTIQGRKLKEDEWLSITKIPFVVERSLLSHIEDGATFRDKIGPYML